MFQTKHAAILVKSIRGRIGGKGRRQTPSVPATEFFLKLLIKKLRSAILELGSHKETFRLMISWKNSGRCRVVPCNLINKDQFEHA
jgi:hypothetical protein